MKGTPAAIALVLAAAFVAGCVQDTPLTTTTPSPEALSFLAGPALWNAPQDAPHPKYGWATLSNPPAADARLPKWWQPANATALPADVTGIQHVASTADLEAGAGLALFGSVAVVPDFGGQVHFVDISQPAAPVKLGSVDSDGRGAAIVAYPDGRLVTAVSTGSGFDVIEFTDPMNPVLLTDVSPAQGGHKLGIVPGTPILYNAASNGGGSSPVFGPSPCSADVSQCTGFTEIYNLTNPAEPTLVKEFQNGLSCHHIFFWNNATQNKFRAICAGIEYTQLWDTADPLNPVVLVSIPVHHGAAGPSGSASIVAFSHSAGLNQAGTVLYVGDESGGGGIPPGCVAGYETPVGTVGTPVGATWFYDVSTETAPKPLGYYSPLNDPTVKSPLRSCTTHHGRLVPEQGRDLLAMSFYGNGFILIDFTGIGTPGGPLPHAVAQFVDGSDTWETWYYNGYIFTGDLARGMDVFKLT